MDNESKTKKKIFFVLFISIFSCMLGVGIIVPILPIYAETLGATGFWLGAIFAGFSFARSISMPLVGRFSDRMGRKRFISFGLLIYALSSLGYIYASSAPALLLVRIIQGFSSAMIIPIAMAFIGDISPAGKEGSYMGIFTIALFLGFGCGPILGGFTKDLIGMQADFLIMGGLCLIAFFMVLIYLPRSSSIQKKAPAMDIPFKTILQSRSIMGICFYRFTSAFCRGSIMTFLPLYAHNALHLNGKQIGLVISSSILLTAILQLPFGKLADKLNRKKLVILGSIFYFSNVPFIPYTLNFAQILILNIILGLFGALSLPAASALTVREGKNYGMGPTMAIFNVSMSVGLAIGPLTSGIVLDIWGLSGVFYFCTTLGFLSTGIVAKLFSRKLNNLNNNL
ncbi:MAG: MFS transporter [Deltaproteobacteria bacterium]|nr:MFS transporter [Deltaproteobacteria bacterium]